MIDIKLVRENPDLVRKACELKGLRFDIDRVLTLDARRRALEPRVAAAIASLDEDGRWLRNGRIECSIFVTNMTTLSEYLELAG